MPYYVVAGGIVQCSHGGQSKIPSGNPKLQVSGNAAVTTGMEVGIPFLPLGSPPTPNNPAPCPQMLQPPAVGPSPCSATMAAIAGLSQKLTIDGVAVLLDSASGLAINPADPAAKWSISTPGQQLLQEA